MFEKEPRPGLPTPEIASIEGELPAHQLRMVKDTEGRFWMQKYCDHHQEWETHPEVAPNERAARRVWAELEQLAALIAESQFLVSPAQPGLVH